MTKSGIIWRAVVAAIILIAAYHWFQNVTQGEEGRVRQCILAAKKAVEEKNLFAIDDMISRSYQDTYGNDRESLLYGIKEVLDYYERIFISIESITISLDEAKTQAEAEVVAVAIGVDRQKNKESFFEGEKGRIKARFVKEENTWRLAEITFFEPMTLMGQTIA